MSTWASTGPRRRGRCTDIRPLPHGAVWRRRPQLDRVSDRCARLRGPPDAFHISPVARDRPPSYKHGGPTTCPPVRTRHRHLDDRRQRLHEATSGSLAASRWPPATPITRRTAGPERRAGPRHARRLPNVRPAACMRWHACRRLRGPRPRASTATAMVMASLPVRVLASACLGADPAGSRLGASEPHGRVLAGRPVERKHPMTAGRWPATCSSLRRRRASIAARTLPGPRPERRTARPAWPARLSRRGGGGPCRPRRRGSSGGARRRSVRSRSRRRDRRCRGRPRCRARCRSRKAASHEAARTRA